MAMGVLTRSLQTSRTAWRPQTGPILAACFGNVRSILEYGCVIWGGAAPTTHLKWLHSIQYKILPWLSYSQQSRPPHCISYRDLLHHFKVSSLKKRRFQHDVCFVHRVVCGKVDSTYLLGCFPLHVPQRRNRAGSGHLLHVPFAHHANKETIRPGHFRRVALAFKAHVGRVAAAEPFHAAPYGFRASVRKFIRNNPA